MFSQRIATGGIMKAHRITALMFCGLLMTVTGCSGHYYKVTDPASGKAYYTTKIDDAGRAGAVKIKDEKTGSTVTLQSSEVKEISGDEYEAALKAQPPAQK
jgi:hypothetical protein